MTLPTNLHVVKHSLIQHKISLLRDKSTRQKEFRELVNEVTILVTAKATKDLPLKNVDIETPLTKTKSK